jgi:hypothetical protein
VRVFIGRRAAMHIVQRSTEAKELPLRAMSFPLVIRITRTAARAEAKAAHV